MEIEMLKNDELISLLDYTETVIDAIIPDMLSLVPEDCMETLIKQGDTQNLPHFDFLSFNLYFIDTLEKELAKRELLVDFCNKKAFVNYESGSMLTYQSYASRYSHLCYCKMKGFLELDRVVEQTEKAKSEYNRLLKEKKKKTAESMS